MSRALAPEKDDLAIDEDCMHQNLVILDYDDTLLPTTFLNPCTDQELETLAVSHRDQLDKIQEQVL